MPNVDDLYDENVEFEIERKKIEDHKEKNIQLEKKPKKENLGATWDSAYGNRPLFPSKDALEAYGEHAYLYAAVTRCTEDLSVLPLKLIKKDGKNTKEIKMKSGQGLL